jgi:hypothetical protein
MMIGADSSRGTVSSVDAGHAQGWDVWPLDDGKWAWRAWISSSGGLSQSGIEPSEAEAKNAAQRALELMVSEARASAQPRRELSVPDDQRRQREPHC